MDRQKVIHTAVTSVAAALANSDPGVKHSQALRFARIMLTRPGVSIGRGGNIFYKGQRYAPTAFASSPLAKLATGQTAAAQNKAAITGDPGYIQAMASLGLQRDQATAGLGDQQRQALIQFGDPTFARGDASTAATASTNPFSTEHLMAQQFQQNKAAATNQANRLGTLYGGGEQAGQQSAQNAYTGQTQDAVTKLSALLSQIQQEQAAAQQAYGVGQTGAYTDAYNALLASGALHAAAPPKWNVGTFTVRPPKNKGVGGFGGYKPPIWGGNPPILGQPNPLPPTYNGPIPTKPGGLGGTLTTTGRPPILGTPNPPYQPLTNASIMRSLGIGV